jgi:hypothetical protein
MAVKSKTALGRVSHKVGPPKKTRQGQGKHSLDLSNQDDVGEAGAIAALDDLYANNDEGMKRLADAS